MSAANDAIAYCHACGGAMDVSQVAPFSNVACPSCGKHTRVKREFGPYTLVRRHAIGGMSMVFVGQDHTLDREVALKILNEQYSSDERRIAAFEEEARVMAGLSHPNIVRLLKTGRSFDRFYIAMELVAGGHFEHRIRELGRIPEMDMLPLAIEVAQGLKAAHAAGLIHRDVKPGNILLDAEGHAKLVDFGLSLVTQGGAATATELWATPQYVPPETVSGLAEDFRSDIYAFGATLYHALCGTPSCPEESMATDILLAAKRRIPALALVAGDVSAETCAIVDRCMAFSPDDRYASYDDLIAALETSLRHLKSGRIGDQARQHGDHRSAATNSGRRKLMALAILGVLGLGIGLSLLNRKQPSPENGTTTNQPSPPPVQVSEPDTAATASDISRIYQNAQSAMESRDYEGASGEFFGLFQRDDVPEPTRSWAGIQAVLADYLDGRSSDAKEKIRAVGTLAKQEETSRQTMGDDLVAMLPRMIRPMPMELETTSDGLDGLAAAMLCGLKNWESGMIKQAVSCFERAARMDLTEQPEQLLIYQKIAGEYLADAKLLSASVFDALPDSISSCEAALDELDQVMSRMKTRGRARFNVRAWQLDVARRKKQLSEPGEQAGKDAPINQADRLTAFAALASEYRFNDALDILEQVSLPESDQQDALVSMTQSAASFLSDLKRGLEIAPVSIATSLRDEEGVTRVSLREDGEILAWFTAGGSRICQWADFAPDALIALHRVLAVKEADEAKRIIRHERAIAFQWLAGDRDAAVDAADRLAASSPEFASRWKSLSGKLPADLLTRP